MRRDAPRRGEEVREAFLILSVLLVLIHGAIAGCNTNAECRRESRQLGAIWSISAGVWYLTLRNRAEGKGE